MIRKLAREDSGYSLVEVIVAMFLLAIAIIPMVGMFDMGLNAASTSGNYDKARMFVNERLEYAKSLPYATVKDSFPVTSSTPTGGSYTSSALAVPSSAGLPSGSTYRVVKQYLNQPPATPTDGSEDFGVSSTDKNLMKITVTVNWSNNKSYTASGVVAG